MLNPETPLFREARYLLAEEPDLRDTALYLSVLAAVAEGNTSRGRMAGYLERKAVDIAHPLHVLEDPDLLGGLLARVGHGVVHDPKARTGHEVDVAVVGIADDAGNRAPLLAIGEAKWNDTMGIGRLDRLRHIRDLISRAGRYDTHDTRLICFSGASFNDRLREAARTSPDVLLVGLPELYGTRP